MTGTPPLDATDLVAARRVLAFDVEALGALSRSLDASFSKAVGTIMRLGRGGRLIVSGMGKSGLVGRKIASTLASTGTPAQFVHPGEASHGDLGMITTDDAVLLLSNSGEVHELHDLIEYSRRYGVPLIAITSRAQSTLARNADAVLLLPPAKEACPMGLAPTTSTTMMIALGDCLAVALMERRGFSKDQYRVLHPGGALGRKLVLVHDIMHTGDEMPVIGPDAGMREVLLVITSKRFGCAGVVDSQGCLTGIITDGDLRRHLTGDLLSMTAGEVMTANPAIVRSDALAVEALRLMNMPPRPKTCLFVVDGGGAVGPLKPVGIIHIHDCLRAGVA